MHKSLSFFYIQFILCLTYIQERKGNSPSTHKTSTTSYFPVFLFCVFYYGMILVKYFHLIF